MGFGAFGADGARADVRGSGLVWWGIEGGVVRGRVVVGRGVVLEGVEMGDGHIGPVGVGSTELENGVVGLS